jgi:hypothetical protein
MWKERDGGKLAVGLVDGYWTRLSVLAQELETGEMEAVLEIEDQVGKVPERLRFGPNQWYWR